MLTKNIRFKASEVHQDVKQQSSPLTIITGSRDQASDFYCPLSATYFRKTDLMSHAPRVDQRAWAHTLNSPPPLN